MIVTIDGPAGAGKSTVARRVATELKLPFLNSGAIYRAVTLLVAEDGERFDDVDRVREIVAGMKLRFEDNVSTDESGETIYESRVYIDDRDISELIRSPEITSQVYRIAGVSDYRAVLVELQRKFAEPLGVVTEGRDMGTVIFPDASCKIYLDASAEERARRRHKEMTEGGEEASYDDVLRAILERDDKDRGREHAPLRVPEGAQVICSDNMTIDQVVGRVVDCARKVLTDP